MKICKFFFYNFALIQKLKNLNLESEFEIRRDVGAKTLHTLEDLSS